MHTTPTSDSVWVLTEASLVVTKSDLDPEAITARLGLEPTATRRPGPDRWDPAGDTDGRWRRDVNERTSREFSEQLDVLLRQVEPRIAMLHVLRDEGCDVFIRIHGFTRNGAALLIPEESLRRLAELDLPVLLSPNVNER